MKNSSTRDAKKAREVFNTLKEGPTPYLDSKGRRIRKSKNGAVFTQNSNGNRNYKPNAVMIKSVAANAPIKVITKNNINTIPKNIRPNNNNNNNNFNVMYYCKSCQRTYDGFAQCCFEMNHVKV